MTDDRKSRAMNSRALNHLTSDELAKIAGVHVDREGLGAEYPKMLYRLGTNSDHNLNSEPALIDGVGDVQTLVVEDAAEEADAVADGWALKVSSLRETGDTASEEPKRGAGRPKLSVSTD